MVNLNEEFNLSEVKLNPRRWSQKRRMTDNDILTMYGSWPRSAD